MGSLVTGDDGPQSHVPGRGERGPDVGIEVAIVVVLAPSRLFAELALGGYIESGPEVLKGLFDIEPGCGYDAENGGESVARHADPVCPCAGLPACVRQCLAAIKTHR